LANNVIYKYFFIIFCLVFVSDCYTQEATEQCKVVNIDSTENNYFIFFSNDLQTNTQYADIPFLVKSDDHCHKVSQCDNSKMFCVFSPKIKGLGKNIYIDSVYKLSTNCFTNETMNESCDYIGHGDYMFLFPNEYICSSKQILGLLHTQDLDSINYFSFLDKQYSLFDNNMLKIWMNFANSKLPYFKWLEIQKANAINIYLTKFSDTIVLFQDENCKLPNITINAIDYWEKDVLKIKLFYKHKNNYFIQIGDNLNAIYAWISGNTMWNFLQKHIYNTQIISTYIIKQH